MRPLLIALLAIVEAPGICDPDTGVMDRGSAVRAGGRSVEVTRTPGALQSVGPNEAPEPQLTEEQALSRIERIRGAAIVPREKPRLVRVPAQAGGAGGWPPPDPPRVYYRIVVPGAECDEEYEIDGINGHLRGYRRMGRADAARGGAVDQSNAEAAARRFLTAHHPDPATGRFGLESVSREPGVFRFRFQKRDGVPPRLVEEAATVEVSDLDGAVVSYRATHEPPEELVAPSLAAEQALDAASRELRLRGHDGDPAANLVQRGKLLYWALFIRLRPGDADAAEGQPPPQFAVALVDARTGRVLEAHLSDPKERSATASELAQLAESPGHKIGTPAPEWLSGVAVMGALLVSAGAAWRVWRRGRPRASRSA